MIKLIFGAPVWCTKYSYILIIIKINYDINIKNNTTHILFVLYYY